MAQSSKDPVLDTLEPQVRLKQLINYSNQVDIGPHVPPLRYYRSGQEMIRMANVYYKEGSLENAYVLYLKFMTLFLEKIRKHPDFRSVSVQIKAKNQATLREVLPRAEKIKSQLLEQYTLDYKKCMAERKQLEIDKKRKEEDKKKAELAKPSSIFSSQISRHSSVIKPPGLDSVIYPDYLGQDIPSAPPPTTTILDVPGYTPTIDRSVKPMDVTAQGRYDTNVLRSVVVPVQVMTLFQAMAQSNTFKNIETCGILAGVLEKNELIITHMILPKQKGTSDSCMTTNEEEIFDYQDQHSLITLGWIHTHPTQTAFLSSVDLHTHCPYQLLMPEAIAIVCSPKYNETGIFNLTASGLKFIANCRQTGFHPHPTNPPLFVEADHVRIENKAPLEVLDLRNK
ncbi:unnamed protein product [Psylliodes chrysocephalus]|uniref:MPN domain-containing protein n=1 Tax=Psylliodes chrysocephalus TaxID=3402493 RepID=A0A9P0G6D7_9CUCU|nr:unnamed protein product [Psylliodes chrysocephala]